jgi:LysM domain
MKLSVAILFGLVLTQGVPTSGLASEEPIPQPYEDPTLEQRLEIPHVYRTNGSESLSRIALKVYGHRTWWSKLRSRNPSVKGYGPKEHLPSGTRIKYLAPQVEHSYVVQKGDNLYRIALWHFGTSSGWKKVYAKNSNLISNPDLIRPGVTLLVEEGGEIQVADAPEPSRHTEPAPKMRKPASLSAPAPNTAVNMNAPAKPLVTTRVDPSAYLPVMTPKSTPRPADLVKIPPVTEVRPAPPAVPVVTRTPTPPPSVEPAPLPVRPAPPVVRQEFAGPKKASAKHYGTGPLIFFITLFWAAVVVGGYYVWSQWNQPPSSQNVESMFDLDPSLVSREGDEEFVDDQPNYQSLKRDTPSKVSRFWPVKKDRDRKSG